MKPALRVGITGGIGSGKSTVCRLFALYGIPVYDSDARAKELMNTLPGLVQEITQLLGAEAYREGKLDRRYVAGRVFADKALLERLDALVHPTVGEDFDGWTARQPGPYVILESAILFSSGFDRRVDVAVAVTAPAEERIARTIAREGCSREQVLGRIASQAFDDASAERATHTIINDGVHSLVEQVAALHERFGHGRG